VPKAYAYFRVAAENLPLAEITDALGVNPTESWSKGDPGLYNPSRPDSGWCLHGPLPQTNTNLREHVEALLLILEQKTSAVRTLSEKYKTYLVCVGYYDETGSPGLSLSRAVVASMASLGLELNADLYFGHG
jgi:hypothetical protein